MTDDAVNRMLIFVALATEATRYTCLTLILLTPSACGDDLRLVTLPDAGVVDAGIDAGDGTRWREPPPPEPEPEDPQQCELTLLWPEDAGPPTGQCAPGWLDTCTGWGAPPTLPTPTDRDCDGINDDECAPYAMLLVIDGSGSMNPWRARVAHALCQLSGRRDALRAMVVFGDRGPDHTTAVSGWGDDICGVLPATSGAELVAEAVSRGPGLVGGWPEGHARMVVIVTDEPPQGLPGTDPVSDLAAACSAGDFRVGVVTTSAWAWRYDQVIAACGGFTALLYEDVTYPMSGAEPPCQ